MKDIVYRKYEVKDETGKVLMSGPRPKYFNSIDDDDNVTLCNNEEEAIGIIVKKKLYSIKGKAQVKDYPFVTITLVEIQTDKKKDK